MAKTPQPVSPVTSPRTSTVSRVFGQVKDTANDRLDHALHGPNSIPHLIAQSRAVRPQATISNDLVANIAGYSPPPGRHPARHMALNVQNAPGPRVDDVIDAIQRYLNIEPRREPTADPLAEDSIARHPQQIIQSAGRWDDARYYQFSSNGPEAYQFRPEYRAWGGRLELELENAGPANVSAPATRPPTPGYSPIIRHVTPDQAFAAQEAITYMTTISAASISNPVTAGPPLMTSDPYHDPAHAAQNAMAKMAESLNGAAEPSIRVGPPNMLDNPLYQPDQALRTAALTTQALAQAPGVLAASIRADLSAGNAYQRAIQTMQRLDIGPHLAAIGGWA